MRDRLCFSFFDESRILVFLSELDLS